MSRRHQQPQRTKAHRTATFPARLEVLEDRRPLGEMLLGALCVSALLDRDALAFRMQIASGVGRTAEGTDSRNLQVVRLTPADSASESLPPAGLTPVDIRSAPAYGRPGLDCTLPEPWRWSGAPGATDWDDPFRASTLGRGPFGDVLPASGGGGRGKDSGEMHLQSVPTSSATEPVGTVGGHALPAGMGADRLPPAPASKPVVPVGLPPKSAVPASDRVGEAEKQRLLSAYARLPLAFEVNRGQQDARVDFLARGPGYTVFLTPTEAVYSLQAKATGTQEPAEVVLREQVVGGNANAPTTGLEPLSGIVNYLKGNDRSRWLADVPTYARVEYREVYPGIDLDYYGPQGQLEYDFIVSPGADAGRIRLAFAGADGVQLDADGNLLIHTAAGDVVQHRPYLYQQVGAERRPVVGRFTVMNAAQGQGQGVTDQQVGFSVGAYDRTRPLVIDPSQIYTTYFGGSDLDDSYAVAVDNSGNAYFTGRTHSTNFPTTSGAVQTSFQSATTSDPDAFVAKLNASATVLLYSTYLGGGGNDQGTDIGVDSSGNAYVFGYTQSTNFPVTTGAFKTSHVSNDLDAFVVKLDTVFPYSAPIPPPLYASYLGGSSNDRVLWMHVDGANNAVYLTGETSSSDFPTTTGAYHTATFGGIDSFISKLQLAGSGTSDLVFSTYLGGSGDDVGNDIVWDGSYLYVTGDTSSTDFPTTNGAFKAAYQGGSRDGWVVKMNSVASSLTYSSYLGGSKWDQGMALALDSDGVAYITGDTFSCDFPTTAGAFQTSHHCPASSTFNGDAFVMKLTLAASLNPALGYSTYLGGSNDDPTEFPDERGRSIAVDGSGNAYVWGLNKSTANDFPTTNIFGPLRSTYNGGAHDGFVTKLNTTGAGLFSGYLGGAGQESDGGLVLVGTDLYVVGSTESTNFPTLCAGLCATSLFQLSNAGDSDAFVMKLDVS
jgi:hypothetical protein